MKRILKIIASLTTCALLAVTTIQAAGRIDANEKKILDVLKAGVVVNGKTVHLDASYITQAENYLMRDGVDMSNDQASVIMVQIEDAKALLIKNNITDLSDLSKLPSNLKSQLLELAQTAAAEMGLTISIDAVNGVITILDKNGNVVFKADSIIKNTGDDYTSTLLLAGSIAILLMGAGLIAYKKGLFAKE